jgi:SAM-dependent methyltransferase
MIRGGASAMSISLNRLPDAARAALALLAALPIAPILSTTAPGWLGALLAGALAAWLAQLMHLPTWWRWICAGFPLLVWAALTLDIAPGIWLGAFALTWLMQGAVFRTRVPLYLSGQAALDALLDEIPTRPGARFIDLGCGLGSALARVARARPDLHVAGVEAAPLPWLASRLRCARREHCAVALGSLWDVDLSGFDVVYAFLSPAPMPELFAKARREMQPGSRFISLEFDVPGHAPTRSIAAGSRLLHVWDM